MHMYFKNFDILKNTKQCDKIIILKIIMKERNDKHLDLDQKYWQTIIKTYMDMIEHIHKYFHEMKSKINIYMHIK